MQRAAKREVGSALLTTVPKGVFGAASGAEPTLYMVGASCHFPAIGNPSNLTT